MHAPRSELADIAADVLARLRDRRPRVHCITNAVAQNFTANVLLAAGAVPSMTISQDEVAEFAAHADSLLINLGTFDAERRTASDRALAAVRKSGAPWLLDPVLIDRSAQRADYAANLLADKPAAIRLNAAELTTLSQGMSPQTFAARHGAVVARTGEVDLVTDGARTYSLENGHALMASITAMGCAASALAAAALPLEADRLHAVAAAVLIFGIAGEIAGERAQGPGSFAVHILDALYALQPGDIRARVQVSA